MKDFEKFADVWSDAAQGWEDEYLKNAVEKGSWSEQAIAAVADAARKTEVALAVTEEEVSAEESEDVLQVYYEATDQWATAADELLKAEAAAGIVASLNRHFQEGHGGMVIKKGQGLSTSPISVVKPSQGLSTLESIEVFSIPDA